MYHQGVMVRETDRKKTIKDKWQTLNHRNLGAMVLRACDQVRKVNEDELRHEGSEGDGEKAFHVEVCAKTLWQSLVPGRNRKNSPSSLLPVPSFPRTPPSPHGSIPAC